MTDRAQEIYQQICASANIVQGEVEGQRVQINVKEMRDHRSSWCTVPSGRYQINVRVPGERRDRIFRTKKDDGSFNMLDIIDAIKVIVRVGKDRERALSARTANTDTAARLREKYSMKNMHLSEYISGSGSHVAPSTTEGKINVLLNFGPVDPAVAEKILAFAQSLE